MTESDRAKLEKIKRSAEYNYSTSHPIHWLIDQLDSALKQIDALNLALNKTLDKVADSQ